MILCVQGPRALLPVPAAEVVPLTMRTDAHLGFPTSSPPRCLQSPPSCGTPQKTCAPLPRPFATWTPQGGTGAPLPLARHRQSCRRLRRGPS
ncbi:hypothetical protein AGOR_G00139630 [Albula goreensis]|uniref:Uncharacterized protein n=1 Tax=Albula goreensis TaxID=1534307 RepID=A0A8T3DEV9_9TELE|nr:hypothetical protein AGOR_G00139630 [Albula goreensis]